MHRLTIRIEDDQYNKLAILAQAQGISFADFMRRTLDSIAEAQVRVFTVDNIPVSVPCSLLQEVEALLAKSLPGTHDMPYMKALGLTRKRLGRNFNTVKAIVDTLKGEIASKAS